MTESEIDALVDSLDEYDEQRVRAAIEAARDPVVGPQLLDRLDEMLDDEDRESDRLARAALAVVVVEAEVPEAFDDLFDRLLDGGGDFIDDIIEYVLCRQGERTVRAAIDHLPGEEDPGARGVLYTLLQSAHGRDPATVADAVAACHQAWERERAERPDDPEDETGWTPAVSLCYALAVLGDGSVRRMIADELGKPRRKEHRINWTAAAEYAEKHLGENPFDAQREIEGERKATYEASRGETPPSAVGTTDGADDVYADDDLDWRQDWTVQLPRWADVYDPAEQEKSFEGFGDQMAPLRAMIERMSAERAAADADGADDLVIDERDFDAPPADEVTMPIRAEQKVGRNDPCPCGSGKKYKKCHGAAGGGN